MHCIRFFFQFRLAALHRDRRRCHQGGAVRAATRVESASFQWIELKYDSSRAAFIFQLFTRSFGFKLRRYAKEELEALKRKAEGAVARRAVVEKVGLAPNLAQNLEP
jgi:hypothetical protein